MSKPTVEDINRVENGQGNTHAVVTKFSDGRTVIANSVAHVPGERVNQRPGVITTADVARMKAQQAVNGASDKALLDKVDSLDASDDIDVEAASGESEQPVLKLIELNVKDALAHVASAETLDQLNAMSENETRDRVVKAVRAKQLEFHDGE